MSFICSALLEIPCIYYRFSQISLYEAQPRTPFWKILEISEWDVTGDLDDAVTKDINAQQVENLAKDNVIQRILLLGPEGSGRSEIFKKLQTGSFGEHGDGTQEKDYSAFEPIIKGNMVEGMKALIANSDALVNHTEELLTEYVDAVDDENPDEIERRTEMTKRMLKKFKACEVDVELRQACELIKQSKWSDLGKDLRLTPALAELWDNEGIQRTFRQRSYFKELGLYVVVGDCIEYFFGTEKYEKPTDVKVKDRVFYAIATMGKRIGGTIVRVDQNIHIKLDNGKTHTVPKSEWKERIEKSNLHRIASKGWRPTFKDSLRARVKTNGITEANFKVSNQFGGSELEFNIIDVGGQRTDRKKWIHCFENVEAVMFVASLSGYCETLAEDSRVNQMTEALDLFEEISNNRWFSYTPIILLLNKSDLFQQKIQTNRLVECPAFRNKDKFDLRVYTPHHNGKSLGKGYLHKTFPLTAYSKTKGIEIINVP